MGYDNAIKPTLYYNSRPTEKYKYVQLLTLLFLAVFLACEVTAWRMVDFFGHIIPASGLIIAILFFLGDIIAEVYGYQVSRKLIWNSLICEIIFGLLITYVVNMPTPPDNKINDSYSVTFEHLIRTNLISCLSVTTGMFTNSFLISKLKIRMNGKKFLFRVILSSSISEAMLCITAYITLFFGHRHVSEILSMILFVWIYKVIFAVVTAPFAPLLSNWLKKLEQSDVYDINIDYSPFRYNSAG